MHLLAAWSFFPLGGGMAVTSYRSAWSLSGVWLSDGSHSWPPPCAMVRIRLNHVFSDGRQTPLLVHCLSPLAVLGFDLLWSFSPPRAPWIGCVLPRPLGPITVLPLHIVSALCLSASSRPLRLFLSRPVWPLRGPRSALRALCVAPAHPCACICSMVCCWPLQPHSVPARSLDWPPAHTPVRVPVTWPVLPLCIVVLCPSTVCLSCPYGVASRRHAVCALLGSLRSPSL
ncbi:hypothetical protein V6N13_098925 [Hibiscus sabdariffa]